MDIGFLAVNKGRKPEAGLDVCAPAIEVEVPTGVSASSVAAVKTHDVVILIFHPNAPQEPAFAGLFQGRDVEHQAAHFPQEFAPYVVELVVLLVEAVGVKENHLQESTRHELRRERKEIANRAENLLSLGVHVRQRHQRDTLRKVRTAQKIFVARGDKAEILVRFQVLDVGLDQWRILPDRLDGSVFVGDHAVDHVIHGPRLIRRLGCCRGSESPQPAQNQDENNCRYSTHFLSPQ